MASLPIFQAIRLMSFKERINGYRPDERGYVATALQRVYSWQGFCISPEMAT